MIVFIEAFREWERRGIARIVKSESRSAEFLPGLLL